MSSIKSPSVSIPKPQKPWKPTPTQRISSIVKIVLAIISGTVISVMTPISGVEGFLIAFFISYLIIDYFTSRIKRGKTAGAEAVFTSFVMLAITLTVLPIASILITTFQRGYKGLHFGMFTKDMSLNSPTDSPLLGGVLHAITGTLLLVLIALVISVPIGILTALYLTEIKGRFTRPIKFLVQAMSGVPSIVAGLFILAAVIYPITKKYNSVQGSLALAILMIPTVARTAEEVLLLVPQDLRESGVALGGTQWRTVAQIVVPAARSGLVTALILGVARVAGETAPIVLLTGGGDKTNLNVFNGPMGSLPFYIWKEFGAGTQESFTRAWAGILILLIIVLSLFITARLLGDRRIKK